MKPLTLAELKKLVDLEILKGNGDRVVMLSNDDEGNGYHYLFFAFENAEDLEDDDALEMSLDERVAKVNKTIILG